MYKIKSTTKDIRKIDFYFSVAWLPYSCNTFFIMHYYIGRIRNVHYDSLKHRNSFFGICSLALTRLTKSAIYQWNDEFLWIIKGTNTLPEDESLPWSFIAPLSLLIIGFLISLAFCIVRIVIRNRSKSGWRGQNRTNQFQSPGQTWVKTGFLPMTKG